MSDITTQPGGALAAIYARVSTDKQEEQRTIESQLQALRDTCRTAGVEVVQEYVDDGVSGTTLDRPALNRLRDDAALGRFQAVYILSPDRLARKYVYQALVLEELRRWGIQVVFLNRAIGDNPEDQLLVGVEGLIAEYERAKLLERSRRGKLHRATLGEVQGGRPPYGYRYVPKTRARPASYELDGDQAQVVRLMFALYLEQHSSYQVVWELDRRGYRAPRGGRWKQGVVQRILRNSLYVGRGHYNRRGPGGRRRDPGEWVPMPTPRIIEDGVFAAVQRLLDSHRGGRCPISRPLSGLVRCTDCGSRYVANRPNRGRYFYYRCSNPQRMRPYGRTCWARAANGPRLEAAVLGAVRRALLQPEVLLTRANSLTARAGQRRVEREAQEQRRRSLEDKRKKLVDLYLEAAISKAEYVDRRREFDAHLAEVAAQISRAIPGVAPLDAAAVRRAVGRLADVARERLDGMTAVEAQQFLRLLIDEIEYDGGRGVATIRGHLPVGEGSSSGDTVANAMVSREESLPFQMEVGL